MYSVQTTFAAIPLKEYIKGYQERDKFILLCKECNRYNSCWACPPYDFDAEIYLSSFCQIAVIGSKITLDEKLKNDTGDEKSVAEISLKVIKEVRKVIDSRLLSFEAAVDGSRALFAGTCHLCPYGECNRIGGLPCRHPEAVRHSLESMGFDVGKSIAKLLDIELVWGKEGKMPDYLVLVSGLMINKKLDIFDFNMKEICSDIDLQYRSLKAEKAE